jgi:chromosome partitioning protein
MARVIAVSNQKGGVGKTTTAINLAASLAAAEIRTLLIDLDSQANATSGFGIRRGDYEKSIYHALIGGEPLASLQLPTELDALVLIPGGRELISAPLELSTMEDRDRRLQWAIEPIRDDYDFILIDCPPSMDLLTVNALVAADGVLIPIQCEYFALEGVSELMGTIQQVREHKNPGLEIEGVLVTMYDDRTNLAKQVYAEIKSFFGSRLFSTRIPRNVRLAEAPSHGRPILLYATTSRGAESYIRLAREVINGLAEKGAGTGAERTARHAGS